jgi:hypothetical protein
MRASLLIFGLSVGLLIFYAVEAVRGTRRFNRERKRRWSA